MVELKPCPNCGGTAKLHKKNNKFYVECDGDCWTQTGKYSYAEDASKKWNSLKGRKEETELLPCPFCGGEARMKITPHIPLGEDYTPQCADSYCCGRITKKWQDREVAVYAWNRRAYNVR